MGWLWEARHEGGLRHWKCRLRLDLLRLCRLQTTLALLQRREHLVPIVEFLLVECAVGVVKFIFLLSQRVFLQVQLSEVVSDALTLVPNPCELRAVRLAEVIEFVRGHFNVPGDHLCPGEVHGKGHAPRTAVQAEPAGAVAPLEAASPADERTSLGQRAHLIPIRLIDGRWDRLCPRKRGGHRLGGGRQAEVGEAGKAALLLLGQRGERAVTSVGVREGFGRERVRVSVAVRVREVRLFAARRGEEGGTGPWRDGRARVVEQVELRLWESRRGADDVWSADAGSAARTAASVEDGLGVGDGGDRAVARFERGAQGRARERVGRARRDGGGGAEVGEGVGRLGRERVVVAGRVGAGDVPVVGVVAALLGGGGGLGLVRLQVLFHLLQAKVGWGVDGAEGDVERLGVGLRAGGRGETHALADHAVLEVADFHHFLPLGALALGELIGLHLEQVGVQRGRLGRKEDLELVGGIGALDVSPACPGVARISRLQLAADGAGIEIVEVGVVPRIHLR